MPGVLLAGSPASASQAPAVFTDRRDARSHRDRSLLKIPRAGDRAFAAASFYAWSRPAQNSLAVIDQVVSGHDGCKGEPHPKLSGELGSRDKRVTALVVVVVVVVVVVE